MKWNVIASDRPSVEYQQINAKFCISVKRKIFIIGYAAMKQNEPESTFSKKEVLKRQWKNRENQLNHNNMNLTPIKINKWHELLRKDFNSRHQIFLFSEKFIAPKTKFEFSTDWKIHHLAQQSLHKNTVKTIDCMHHAKIGDKEDIKQRRQEWGSSPRRQTDKEVPSRV